MPSNVVDSEKDEEKWKKAKEKAKEQGKGDDYEYIMGIYKKMGPEGIDKDAFSLPRFGQLTQGVPAR